MASQHTLQRILIIDDDADYRKLLRAWLGVLFQGVDVVEYDPPSQGAPGPDFNWADVDVLLLDYNLRLDNANGIDILNGRQADPAFPATVMLTSAGSEEVAVRAFRSGIEDYLRKEDVTKEMLRSAIETAYTRHFMKRQRLCLLEEMRNVARQESEKLIEDYKNKLAHLRALEEKRMQQERQRMAHEVEEGKQQLARLAEEQKHAEISRRVLLDEIQKLKEELMAAAHEPKLTTRLETTHKRYEEVSAETKRLRENMERAVASVDKNKWQLELTKTLEAELAKEAAEFKVEADMKTDSSFTLLRRTQSQQAVAQQKKSAMDKDDQMLKDVAAQLKKDQ
jgi:CheY-like chemotaxis protein